MFKNYRAVLVSLCFVLCSGTWALGQEWRAAGPAPGFFGGVDNVPPDDPITGAIEQVVTHPSSAGIMWIGSVNGGIWRTDNATSASPFWVQQKIGDGVVSIDASIAAMDLDPTDPSSRTLVAGTGSTSSFGRISNPATGILKTTDGGFNWSFVTATNLPAGAEMTGIISRGNVIVASLSRADELTYGNIGLWRSEDGGESFTHITGETGTGIPFCITYDLIGDPVNNSRIYAVARVGFETNDNGIYASDDIGATWTRITNDEVAAAITTDNFFISPNRAKVVIGPNNNIFFGVLNAPNAQTSAAGLTHIFHSPDGGTTWNSLDLPNPTIHPGFQGGIHFSMAADPTNGNVVYLGGDRQNLHQTDPAGFPNEIGASAFTGTIWRCDASLETGSQCAHATHSNSAGPRDGGTASGSASHADSRDMAFDAAGNLIQTDDGGIYRRTSPADNTGDWFGLVGNMQVGEAHSVTHDSVSKVLFGGTQDNGTTLQAAPGSVQHVGLFGGDGGRVTVDDSLLLTEEGSTRYISAQQFGGATRAVFDPDGGLVSFARLGMNFPKGLELTNGEAFYNPILVNQFDPLRVVVQRRAGLFESFDQGDNFVTVSTDVGHGFSPIESVSYGAADNTNILYATNSSGVFVRSGEPGSDMVATAPLPEGENEVITGVAVHPARGSEVFVVSIGRVFHSTDTGASWTEITGSLAEQTSVVFRTLAVVPNNDRSLLYVSGVGGLFVATEAGNYMDWQQQETGLPDAPIFQLDYDARDHLLTAATVGRGNWSLTPPRVCRGDFNGDYVINAPDVSAMAANWTGENEDQDFVDDNIINVLDLVFLGSRIGGACVPEPVTEGEGQAKL